VRRAAGLIVLAVATAAFTGCGVLWDAPSPTSTYTGADGEPVTVDWVDYPGEAWQDSAPLLTAPDQDEVEPIVRQLLEELREAVESAAGVALEPVGSPGAWFQESNWYASQGNGYGGESMLVTLNCCDLQSDIAPPLARWPEVLAAASAVTEELGLGPLVLEQDSAPMAADPAWQKEYAEKYCNGPDGGCWLWAATAYADGQWLSFSIQDSARDTTGVAAEEAEEFGWPPSSVSFSYGATVIRAGMRDDFARAYAPFAGLDKPAQTTSD
jgi:hypothetical protein